MEITATEMAEQVDFHIAVGSKVAMSSFRGHWSIAYAIPEEDRFTQAGPCCNQGDRLFPLGRRTGVQHTHFFGPQQKEAIGRRLQIIQKLNLWDVEPLFYGRTIDHPGKIRRAAMIID